MTNRTRHVHGVSIARLCARGVVFASILICLEFVPALGAENTRRFTVADSIAMTRLVDPSPRDGGGSETFNISPDGKRFVIVTRKGSLEFDTLTYELKLYDVSKVLDFLNDEVGENLPEPRILATFESIPIGSGYWRPEGISDVKWLADGHTVAFMAEQTDTPWQIYTVDVRTGELRRLTSPVANLRRFDVSANARRLVYVARASPPDLRERNLKGYAVQSTHLRELLLLEHDEVSFKEEASYLVDVSSRNTRELGSEHHKLSGRTWLSPDGRWAITQAFANDIPADTLLQYDAWRYVGASKREYDNSSAFAKARGLAKRFVLIDTESGAIKEITTAHTGFGAQEVFWSSDGQTAIIVNTHLPLHGVDHDERERRGKTVSLVEFDLETRRLTPIAYLPHRAQGEGGGVSGLLVGANSLGDGAVSVRYRTPTGVVQSIAYRKDAVTRHWVREEQLVQAEEPNSRLSLAVVQDMNTPPEILAVDTRTGRRRLITDLNPQLRQLPLGHMKEFVWTDKNGRIWKGGLLLPPDHRPDEQYPLVIQTYGFSPNEFLVDGPRDLTSAFAARPLASMGLVVLQMSKQPITEMFELGVPSEGSNFIAGYEGAVRELHASGVVDPRRVGIIGWSRTGMHVSYAVAFSEIRFAAATIADAAATGYMSYVARYGKPFPGMVEAERMIGGSFWGDDRNLWLERSPNLNAHRVYSPLRIETYGTYLNPYWGMYAMLRLHNRPAEMIHIPIASHMLRRPQARYASQQGNVDWFAFWLIGYEDPDPSKKDQYVRWRKLRQQHYDTIQPAEFEVETIPKIEAN